MIIMFPSSYNKISQVDIDLQNEFKAAIYNNFSIVFFDYTKWFQHNILELFYYNNLIPDNENVLYRGWMMKPNQYELFYKECQKQGLSLIIDPIQYKNFHIYPNIYPYIKKDAAPIMTFSLNEKINVSTVYQRLGPFMIKDFVKSVKGTDFPKFFDEKTSQNEFDNWMQKFRQYRGLLLTGGIVCKKYYNLKLYNNKQNEYRVFYGNGNIISICENSNQSGITKKPPDSLILKYANLPSAFYTVDYAELSDDSWIIIEAGDGQVSGPSPNQDLCQFYRNIYYALDNNKDYVKESNL